MYAKVIRDRMAKLAHDMRAIVETAKSQDNRGLTTEEAEKFDAMEVDYSALEASLARAEKSDNLNASLREQDPAFNGIGAGAPSSQKKDDRDPHAVAFSKYLRGGMEALNQEERQIMARNMVTVQNTMSTTTGSQGGYTVPQSFSDQLEQAQKWFGGIDGTVEQFMTDTGAPLPWPTDNDTAQTGEVIGQNTAVASQDIAFNQVIFGSFIFSSKLVKVPLALMQDSYFNVDSYLASKLGTRLGRIKNTKFTVGAGTTEPLGIQAAAVAAGNTFTPTTGNATSVSYDSLVELEHAVDPAYRNEPTAAYMFHDSTLKAIKKLKDGQSRPIWLPLTDSSLTNSTGATILNHKYVINNDMPVMAANANSILFGDLSKYKVRNIAGGTSILRLVERYAEFLQVGYIAFTRADGNLIDAGTHPIAVYTNSAT
jgi:HK97 family phage major capsid protein